MILKRSRLKWILTAVIALWIYLDVSNAPVAFAATRRWYFWISPRGCQVHYGWHQPGTGLREEPPGLSGGCEIDSLLPVCLLLMTIVLLFWRDWRDRLMKIVCARKYVEGACQNCGYSLSGNVSGICPECGRNIAETEANPRYRNKTICQIGAVLAIVVIFYVIASQDLSCFPPIH